MISDDSDSEDDIATLKRKSLIMIEQSLDSPCDESPLQPSFMVEAEKPGQNIEKLLMERVMLRKELRLRSVQVKIIYLYICWCVCVRLSMCIMTTQRTKASYVQSTV